MASGDPVDLIWGYFGYLRNGIMLPWVLRDGRARSTVDVLEAKKGRHERKSKQESRQRGIHKKKAIHNTRKRVKTRGSGIQRIRMKTKGSDYRPEGSEPQRRKKEVPVLKPGN